MNKPSVLLAGLAKTKEKRIDEYHFEGEDGHLVYLVPGWNFEGCVSIRGATVRDVFDQLNRVVSSPANVMPTTTEDHLAMPSREEAQVAAFTKGAQCTWTETLVSAMGGALEIPPELLKRPSPCNYSASQAAINELEQAAADEVSFVTWEEEYRAQILEMQRTLEAVHEWFEENIDKVPAPLAIRVAECCRPKV